MIEQLDVVEDHLERARKHLDVAGEELQALIIDNAELAGKAHKFYDCIALMKNHIILSLTAYDKLLKRMK